MAKYLGRNIRVAWAGTPFPHITSAAYDERSEINRVDVSSAENSALEYLDDLQDTAQVDLTISGFIPTGGNNNIVHTLNTDTAAGSVDYQPEGNASSDLPWYYEGQTAKIVAKRLGGNFRVGQPYEFVIRKNTGPFNYKVTT